MTAFPIMSALRILRDNTRNRLQFIIRPATLPLALLVLSLSTVFVFGSDRAYFDRGNNDWITAQHLAIAVNLSPEHNFLQFINQSIDVDGEHSYIPYSRWPIGSYALVKLSTLPFDNSLSGQIHAMRILMLGFYVGTALLAYLSLARITNNQWIALTATLMAFSSFYLLYWNDAFDPSAGPALFGVMLAFHGMTVWIQEKRFRQLLFKTGIALLLCWHVYALLLPFIIFGLAGTLISIYSTNPITTIRYWTVLKHYGFALLRSRYLMLGLFALFFGISLFSFNIGSEYYALRKNHSLTTNDTKHVLPTIQSLQRRTDLNKSNNNILIWHYFIRNQIYRITNMVIPTVAHTSNNINILTNPSEIIGLTRAGSSIYVGIGILILCVGLIGLFFIQHKILTSTLLLSGIFWALPGRNFVAHHEYQSIFYVGIPLLFYALLMIYLFKKWGMYPIYVCTGCAIAVFIFSVVILSHISYNEDHATWNSEILDDYTSIREIVGERVVYVPDANIGKQLSGAPFASSYFLTGSILEFQRANLVSSSYRSQVEGRSEYADFIILSDRVHGPALLTPDNRHIFLYDIEMYDQEILIISSDYDVYLQREERKLKYVSDICANEDAQFFLHITPAHARDLPEHHNKYDFVNKDFSFDHVTVDNDGKCVAIIQLPLYYNIGHIQTGQYTEDGRLWDEVYKFK